MAKATLVVIHGVGDSPPGASLREVCEGLDAAGVAGERSDILIGGVTFPSLKLQHPVFSRLLEVNWSDVARPSRASLFAYFARIIVTLFTVAGSMPAGRSKAAAAYQFTFESLLAYCIYPALAMMLFSSVPPPLERCQRVAGLHVCWRTHVAFEKVSRLPVGGVVVGNDNCRRSVGVAYRMD